MRNPNCMIVPPIIKIELLAQIQNHHEEVCEKELKSNRSSLFEFLNHGMREAKQKWFIFMGKFLKFLYSDKENKKSPLLKIFYRTVPELIVKYIKHNEVKYEGMKLFYEGIEDCLLIIYNNEFQRYNEKNEEKIEFSKDQPILKIYSVHLNKEMSQFKRIPLQPLMNLTNLTKNNIKIILFFLVYIEAQNFDDEILLAYYRTLFMYLQIKDRYCGADEKELGKQYSFYLLQKKNVISIFKYAITEEELQWIILTLYQLCIKVKQHKFQLLAAINIVHKKTSNQCQFKMSEIAQSLVHLLEDEYSQVFG